MQVSHYIQHSTKYNKTIEQFNLRFVNIFRQIDMDWILELWEKLYLKESKLLITFKSINNLNFDHSDSANQKNHNYPYKNIKENFTKAKRSVVSEWIWVRECVCEGRAHLITEKLSNQFFILNKDKSKICKSIKSYLFFLIIKSLFRYITFKKYQNLPKIPYTKGVCRLTVVYN